MAKKKKTTEPSGSRVPPNLVVARAKAESGIAFQIDKGKQLLGLPIRSVDDLEKARAKYLKWCSFNTELLKRLFDSSEVSEEDKDSYGGIYSFSMNPSLGEKVEYYRVYVQREITHLESIQERLPLYEELSRPLPMTEEQQVTAIGNKVFIVHGWDETTKQTTARFLEKLGLEPIILHEQPNIGRTIIEKFEDYSSVAFAVVLLSPDDLGGSASEKPKLSLRSRQNVVFELGYFIGKLGRKRVCALYQKDVKLPSDFHGVLYVPLDEAGAWKFLLAKELKAGGLDIDLNKAV